LDIIETHAYNFKRRIKYDIFKKCESIWRSRPASRCCHVLDTQVLADIIDKCDKKSKADIALIRSTLPRENERYYREVFKRHEELKTELGEEHPSFGSTSRYDSPEGSIRSLVDAKIIHAPPKSSPVESAVSRRSSLRGKRDSAEFISLEDVEGILKKRRRTASPEAAPEAVPEAGVEAEDGRDAPAAAVSVPVDSKEAAEATESDEHVAAAMDESIEARPCEESSGSGNSSEGVQMELDEDAIAVPAAAAPPRSIEDEVAEDAVLSRLLAAVEASASVSID
jgi:hypothetical protein